jgi:hypothetical protein
MPLHDRYRPGFTRPSTQTRDNMLQRSTTRCSAMLPTRRSSGPTLKPDWPTRWIDWARGQVLDRSPMVRWDEIAGLAEAKQLLCAHARARARTVSRVHTHSMR